MTEEQKKELRSNLNSAFEEFLGDMMGIYLGGRDTCENDDMETAVEMMAKFVEERGYKPRD